MTSLPWRAVLAVVLAWPILAQGTPPNNGFLDLWQTVLAVKRLQEDDALAPHHLGVKVRNRVATLWGPAPSAELAIRAEGRLRAMVEFVEVRNELIVMPDEPSFAPAPANVPQRPVISPEKRAPDAPGGRIRPGLARLQEDDGAAWDGASAKR